MLPDEKEPFPSNPLDVLTMMQGVVTVAECDALKTLFQKYKVRLLYILAQKGKMDAVLKQLNKAMFPANSFASICFTEALLNYAAPKEET